MFLTLCLLSLFIFIWCVAQKWLGASVVAGACVLALWWGVGGGPLAQRMLDGLQSTARAEPAWGAENVIVLLGAGGTTVPGLGVEPHEFAYARLVEAARLYRDCRAEADRRCEIIVSGGDAGGLGRSEAAVYRPVLERLGVARADMVLEDRSLNTWQNAEFTAGMLADRQPQVLLLVTSAPHMRRALLYFGHFGLRPRPARADYVDARMSWLPLAFNLLLADIALHEYLGLLRYRVYSALGWNPERGRPGQS